jgi:hypothetical protein
MCAMSWRERIIVPWVFPVTIVLLPAVLLSGEWFWVAAVLLASLIGVFLAGPGY